MCSLIPWKCDKLNRAPKTVAKKTGKYLGSRYIGALKKIYDKWEQKKLKREKLIKNFFSINTNTAGEEACTKILEYNNLS